MRAQELKVFTREERTAAADELLRVRADRMTPLEMDWGIALLLGKNAWRSPGGMVFVQSGDGWTEFAPTTNWEAYGELVSSVDLVTGTHVERDDPTNELKVTGRWYSCHAFYSATETNGRGDLRLIVAQSAIKLLEHNFNYDRLE